MHKRLHNSMHDTKSFTPTHKHTYSGYFSQFGKLTRVRLSRNKKTGKAKHYAFLEFQHPDVARIVSDAMDGYFMFSQKLTCKLMQPEQVRIFVIGYILVDHECCLACACHCVCTSTILETCFLFG